LVIEIFGLTFKPEISISDIAGIAALISSALIFYFGYSRTRKSEQIKISREVTDRIDVKSRRLTEIARFKTKEDVIPTLNATDDLLSEIEYFGYLLWIREIRDENILIYCIPRINQEFRSVELSLRDLKELKNSSVFDKNSIIDKTTVAFIDHHHDRLNQRLNNIRDSMKCLIDKYTALY
jgi:hypothetical protein